MRRDRREVVTHDTHELLGAAVIGEFGEGVIEEVQTCGMWSGRCFGIRYDNDALEAADHESELSYEDEDDVEFL
jgi:hypothetical protein